MASKNNKANKNMDTTVNIAMEELLELSTIEFNKVEKTNLSKTNASKYSKGIEVELDEDFDPTSLASIIKHARKAGAYVKGFAFIDPNQKNEDDIISKAKSQGKSAYDSDVLRELILQRQKIKNESKGLNCLINKIKK